MKIIFFAHSFGGVTNWGRKHGVCDAKALADCQGLKILRIILHKKSTITLIEGHLRTKLSTQVSRDALHLVDVLVLGGDCHAILRQLKKLTFRIPLMTNQLMFFSMMVAK